MLILVFFDILVNTQFPNFSIESTVHLALVVRVLCYIGTMNIMALWVIDDSRGEKQKDLVTNLIMFHDEIHS